ncbi:hypothetical protein B0J12DRAFT_698093 [Macrophomina phaseolina]|uniref:Uncharacterized protein n=1 Tax=Macrophomina phaseolina TaxID=35725 RepID=A0ABQ8GIP6_9PEZI|nr:hypothetical protein B0J12DRAFT_698093 [Macrophomina phaseolina]
MHLSRRAALRWLQGGGREKGGGDAIQGAPRPRTPRVAVPNGGGCCQDGPSTGSSASCMSAKTKTPTRGNKEAIWAFDQRAWLRTHTEHSGHCGCCRLDFGALGWIEALRQARVGRAAVIFARRACMWRTEMIEEARKEAEGTQAQARSIPSVNRAIGRLVNGLPALRLKIGVYSGERYSMNAPFLAPSPAEQDGVRQSRNILRRRACQRHWWRMLVGGAGLFETGWAGEAEAGWLNPLAIPVAHHALPFLDTIPTPPPTAADHASKSVH